MPRARPWATAPRRRTRSTTPPRTSTRPGSPRQGAIPPDVGDGEDLGPGVYEDELHGDDFERADDAVEGDAVSARDRERAEAGHPRRKRGRVITFLGHCVDELRRVQWPNRRQVGQATAVVLGFVVIAGGYLGLLDALWQPLIEAIL